MAAFARCGSHSHPFTLVPGYALQFERLHNFRDVGGHETQRGRRLRTGVLFRCAELQQSTARDLTLLRDLGIRLICDLRSPAESARKQPRQLWAPPPRLVNVPLHDPAVHDRQRQRILGFLWGKDGPERFRSFCHLYYQHLAFERAARIGEVLTLLASPDSQPALIHCTAGKDRTGMIVAFLQLLLDVPFETVQREYLRTNEDTAPRLERLLSSFRLTTFSPALSERMRLIVTTHPEYLAEVHRRIVDSHGSIEQYVRQLCGLSLQTVEQLRRQLVE